MANIYRFDEWTLFIGRRELRDANNQLVFLTTAQFDFLKALCEQPQTPLTRKNLMMARNPPLISCDRAVDMTIWRLRQKLGDGGRQPNIIKTIRNVGYYFTPSVSEVP